MLRKEIIKKHINTEDIHHIISHHGSVFIKDTVRILFFLLILYVIYLALSAYITWSFLPWVFGAVGIGFFMKFVVDFLNLYLDGLVLSSEGITLFMWEGLTKYKTDFFERKSIETVSHTQNTAWDKLFSKGDLSIRLEHEIEFPFDNVASPSKQVSKILQLKEKYMDGVHTEDEIRQGNQENISLLSEALGEVVKEYLEKKSSAEKNKEFDEDSFLN